MQRRRIPRADRVGNAQVEKLFRYQREEVLVANGILYRDPVASPPPQAVLRPAPVRPMVEGLGLHGRRKDGTEFPVKIGLSPLETEE